MKRAIFIGAAGVLIAGWLLYDHVARIAGDPAESARVLPVPVTAGRVTAHDVAISLVGIGTVQAYNTVTIRTRVDGELMNVAFREGQDVHKGDVLAQIDPRPFQAALDNAIATLARDQANLTNARHDLERYQSTAAKGYSSRQQLDTQAAAVDASAATVQADRAAIENARVQLGYCTIVSPLDGVTGIRLVDQGNIVHAADAVGLVVVTQLQPISAIFTLPQDQMPQVVAARAAGPVVVTALGSDAAAELDQGTLELIDNQIDPTTGSIRLKAKFPNADRKLWPGQFVNVRVRIGVVHDGLTVSSRAVQRGPKGFFVFVVGPDSKVELRPVEIGQEDRGTTLVTKGLRADETVVLDGQLRLRPDSLVQIVETEAAHDGETVGEASTAPSPSGNAMP